ncbi:class I SAM-dependent methyltransferase [Polymorphobacter megasporae]|nr:class I SAM-dependent methyltransferase [Polymorphobacter megasporae]
MVRQCGACIVTGFDLLPPGSFDKVDSGDDLAFYAPPRLVTHIDEVAVAALTAFYRELLPNDGRILDLMSSWISHLPEDRRYAVVGHGMNAAELAANSRLSRWFVQDLNADPALPLSDGAFEAALCCVGVQYLQRPFEVFTDVRRVLSPGARFIVSYANRCFPTKAVAIWRSLDMRQQASLISLYLERAGFTDVEASILSDGSQGDPLIAVVGRA